MDNKKQLIIALDVDNILQANQLILQTREFCSTYKVGLEFFLALGINGVRSIQDLGVDVFLDLKLHDIPNTVHSALLQVFPLEPRFITVHASGGPAMLDAAQNALLKTQGANPRTTILAVTVLTSLSTIELEGLGILGAPSDIALRWIRPIAHNPYFGAVCSPHEVRHLRMNCSPDFTLVCPGIRPSFSANNDQTRIATPADAIYNGANYLVVGRPITQAADPSLAARSVINEISAVEKANSK